MPGFEAPEGLYISVSQVKRFLTCPASYEFKYIRREDPAFVPVNMAFGSAVHAALAAFYAEMKHAGEPLRRDLVLDVFRETWAAAAEGPVPLQPDDEDDTNLDQLTDRGVAMLGVFYEQSTARAADTVVEDVERSLTVDIADPSSGELLDEKLVGVVDAVVRERDRVVVLEHKTAAKKYSVDQVRWDIQPTAYRMLCRGSGLGDVGVRYQILTKGKTPALQLADVARDERDEHDLLTIIVGVLNSIAAGVSYPIRGWQCRTCPYTFACTPHGFYAVKEGR